MKKIISILFTIFLLSLLMACNSSNQAEEANQNDNEVEEEPQIDEESQEHEENTEEPMEEENDADNEVEEENIPVENQEKEKLYEVAGNWDIVPLNESANEDIVLLTIDDAPDGHAVEMAKTLKELNASAIFFVNGHFLQSDEQKEALKTIHEMGFAIGNHTFNHQRLSEVDEATQREEIDKLSDLIEEIVGERPVFFRAPNGVNTDFATKHVEEQGMLLMNWTYGYDWEADYRSKEAIADIMVNTDLLHAGANLLMHDREWTAEGLEDIVIGLREKGYEMVDPELIKTP
ncbi:polysaccharide deacetylase family protein [Saliterribacillus persicus]|uniref:Peptidoglycan/xylan/chitin deacetylase (PgdA/CDA1 family) n=1 Tax=Saliterribacillus persicus TaxID=930114 RepID=A0A368XV28_9BACI|nr:polysaccharide deacetylase family protein [Saliterribacillus persicus]RCW71823.1 peptidoglycan/xylan/chitin deacetylase (PgdA/CDA1 family) [Saliterribacillus persicus]